MDRGTTAGLLVHEQNDMGILGSLPPQVDKNLLSSWGSRLTTPQDVLLNPFIRRDAPNGRGSNNRFFEKAICENNPKILP